MDLIDTSNKSLSFGLCILVLLCISFKVYYDDISFRFEDYIEKDPYYETKLNLIFLGISLLCTFLAMVFFKQYLVYTGSQIFLDEPFDD